MPRVLIAENDLALLELTAKLLRDAAEVDTAATLAEALRLIVEREYQFLLTDLNLRRGGEGLLLASAMRALHPQARNIMITGYPDFAGALAAIQSTLDEIHLKPLAPEMLRHLWGESGPSVPPVVAGPGLSSIWDLIGREHHRIVGSWLQQAEADPQLGAIHMTTAQRLDHMSELVDGLRFASGQPEEERTGAIKHGRERRNLGYRAEWLSIEISFLRRAISDVTLSALLELDLSRFPRDLFALNLRLDADLLESLRAFGLNA